MIKLNNHLVTPTIFPDKTSQVWKLPEEAFSKPGFGNTIYWEFEQEAEFMWVAQLVDLVYVMTGDKKIDLEIPFFPYARQDKDISNGNTFAKKTFKRLLETLPYVDRVKTLDVHSSQNDGYFIQNQSPLPFIKQAIRKIGPSLIVFPDAGAETRYGKMLEAMPNVTCEKVRDCGTGDIVGMTLDPIFLKEDDRILIVDDLTDGGRTFIEVAKLLQKAGIADINLFTTHGIYSKGLSPLREAGILRIFNYKGEVL